MANRKYEVCGKDDLGDIYSFHTDDAGRAQEVAELMRDDLDRSS